MSSQYSDSHSKLDRKLLKKPDSFLASITDFFSQLFEHSRMAVGVIGGLLIICTATAFYLNHREHQNQKARNALYLAAKSLNAELAADMKAHSKDKSDDTSKTLQDRFKEPLETLKAVEHDFPKTRSAFEARLQLGHFYFTHGEYDTAVTWYQKGVDTAPTSFDKTMALSALGTTYENQGKGNAAIQTFQQAIDLGEGSLKGELMLSMARCYEELHDTAKAQSTYDQILSELPNTEYSRNAELFKNRL